MSKSYGIKQQIGIQQQQLQHGMKKQVISYNQSTASRGRPHGRNQQQQLNGNSMKYIFNQVYIIWAFCVLVSCTAMAQKFNTHEVKRGETLESISKLYGNHIS
mgnify:CR=1 FL=1